MRVYIKHNMVFIAHDEKYYKLHATGYFTYNRELVDTLDIFKKDDRVESVKEVGTDRISFKIKDLAVTFVTAYMLLTDEEMVEVRLI